MRLKNKKISQIRSLKFSFQPARIQVKKYFLKNFFQTHSKECLHDQLWHNNNVVTDSWILIFTESVDKEADWEEKRRTLMNDKRYDKFTN